MDYVHAGKLKEDQTCWYVYVGLWFCLFWLL